MKLSQKLIVTIEDVEYRTTYDDLDDKLKPFATRLEDSDIPILGVSGVHITSGNATLYIGIKYAGAIPKRAKKYKIFGYGQDDFMSKQYK
jgi:hypothetical protein